MLRDESELLLKFLHFSNNEEQNLDRNRPANLNPLLNLLQDRFTSVYMPDSVITIDETMAPWQA